VSGTKSGTIGQHFVAQAAQTIFCIILGAAELTLQTSNAAAEKYERRRGLLFHSKSNFSEFHICHKVIRR